MSSLVRQRCANHELREAVALCPDCRRYFCRECVTEHDDRVLCASCLMKNSKGSAAKRFHLRGLIRTMQLVACFFMLWMFFYFCGRVLLKTPSAFHDANYLFTRMWGE